MVGVFLTGHCSWSWFGWRDRRPVPFGEEIGSIGICGKWDVVVVCEIDDGDRRQIGAWQQAERERRIEKEHQKRQRQIDKMFQPEDKGSCAGCGCLTLILFIVACYYLGSTVEVDQPAPDEKVEQPATE